MSIATGIAVGAMYESSEAKRTACEAMTQTFDNKSATVQSMQQYADCVNLLYPQDLSDGAMLFAKLLVILGLVLWAGVGTYLYKKGDSLIEFAIMGFIAGLAAPLIVAFLIFIVGFLFA